MPAYQPDRSLAGKLRRRLVRIMARRPLATQPPGPMLSISFDDAPLTAAVAGAALLEVRGLAGTYYVSAGLCGTEAPMGRCAEPVDYQRLARTGHACAARRGELRHRDARAATSRAPWSPAGCQAILD